MGKNINLLGATIAQRATKTANDAMVTSCELGRIDENVNLIPDSLGMPIPKGEYMIPLTLTGDFLTKEESPYCTTGGSCTHKHRLPEKEYRPLKSGDRVLIAWCGNEPVVISVVVSS